MIDNYTGNGGLLNADWIECVEDDSITQKVTRIILEEGAESGKAYQMNRCARSASKLLQVCP